ncbi:MAG: peptidylprolyl isomerase [Bacteroides sp.]|nr:peptidylprolyl isomerase [Bacteroides sp.]
MTDTINTRDAVVEIETTLGPVTVRLYGDTPRHRDNFLKLAKEGFYDGLLFHRVIKDFMVQAGDPTSRDAAPGRQLGAGDPNYTIEAEIDYPRHYHKYGALAAARTGDQVNPERRSSGSQFYIVTGQKYGPRNIAQIEHRLADDARQQLWMKLQKENHAKIMELRRSGDAQALEAFRQELIAEVEAKVQVPELPEQLKTDYVEIGGTPHLDGQYTVFGEVINGMDTVEKIQNVSTDAHDRPEEDVKIISMKVLEE